MSAATTPTYEWKTLPWRKLERGVFKLQRRIYQASSRGDQKAVHRLQRLLLRSRAAKLLAVRRVSQDNRGKRTAGVDGVKTLTPAQRLALAEHLGLPEKSAPARRVWIPKPGTSEQRPLGIPTLRDRAAQALAKLALEPEWEARFEPNSYGFRPGRSAHDAIVAIVLGLCRKAKYVLDADIAKCFDRIDQQALLQKLQTITVLRRAIRAWLRAGVLDGRELFPTDAGTPQGGVLSPLLANIALHGLETAISTAYPPSIRRDGEHQGWRPIVIRYADDLVILHPDQKIIRTIQRQVMDWLAGVGLELHPGKTRIVHSLHDHNGHRPGFDFLGFSVRQHPVGKTHAGTRSGRPGDRLGFKTLLTPSKEAKRRHSDRIRTIVHAHKAAPQAALIQDLTPVIRGWSQYYATVASSRTFAKMDRRVFQSLRRWAYRRHPRKGRRWCIAKYWRLERGHWDFGTPTGPTLIKHQATAHHRHVKVRGARSLFDGDWVYWSMRLGRHPELPTRVARLLRRQRGRCARCGLFFRDGDLPEIDHVIPRKLGGPDGYSNWQLLHRHCHDQKTAEDAVTVSMTTDQLTEEPDEGKLSRPVLEAGGGR
jgi:RNA-directed DNA polymerase